MDIKQCPYCAEDIRKEAIKCRHCGEFLEKKREEPWYVKTPLIILAFLAVGPLALPLIWIHPTYSRKKKLIITGIVVILTILLSGLMMQSVKRLQDYYQDIWELTQI